MALGLRRLLVKIAILAVPLLAMLGIYLSQDPFKVIYDYDNYDADSAFMTNRDVVSTRKLIHTQAQRGYDSFIFGSSRSLAFLCDDWRAHLAPGSRPFHFDA